MGNGFGMDVARQSANVVGAVSHIVAGMILATGEMPVVLAILGAVCPGARSAGAGRAARRGTA
jgi:hypothetical protein